MTGILFIMFQRGGGKNEESEILGAFILPPPPPPPPQHPSPTLTNLPPSFSHYSPRPSPPIKKKPPPKTSFPTPLNLPFESQKPPRYPPTSESPTHIHCPATILPPIVPKIPLSTSHFSAAPPPPSPQNTHQPTPPSSFPPRQRQPQLAFHDRDNHRTQPTNARPPRHLLKSIPASPSPFRSTR